MEHEWSESQTTIIERKPCVRDGITVEGSCALLISEELLCQLALGVFRIVSVKRTATEYQIEIQYDKNNTDKVPPESVVITHRCNDCGCKPCQCKLSVEPPPTTEYVTTVGEGEVSQ